MCGRHAGNQCRVWQNTLAISAACGNPRWQLVPRVAIHTGISAACGIKRLPVPRMAGPMRGSGTQDLSPLDVSLGGGLQAGDP